ncbi:MAG TPA: hypothetical protein PLN21_12665 [Gemmatales bacterium]|nr:hypothetical protein [Gemmatales bacterium]
MMTCQSCSEQLLEYVYGLLDSSDSVEAVTLTELRAHLETCPQCQAAYERAKKQQSLLGQASRVKTDLTFVAPKVEPRRTALVRQRSSTVSWYATAASLLVGFLAITGSAYWWGKTTRWQAIEEARINLETVKAQPAPDAHLADPLQQQLASQLSTVELLKKSLIAKETLTEKELLASTSYQQVLAPSNVEASNDAPMVIVNQTLTEQPAPINEVANKLTDTSTQNTMTQQYRRSGLNSNKYLYTVPSIAFDGANQATNRKFNNEVSQDIANNVLGYKINHPITVLQAELAAHLCTDKPLYQPGEEVFFRGLALDKANFTPIKDELEFTFALTAPGMDRPLKKVAKVAHVIDPATRQLMKDLNGKTIQAIGCDSFPLPLNMPLGESTLTLTEKNNRFPQQTVKFMVNSLTAPKFDKQLQFTRASYAPGDEVTLTGKIKLPGQQPWRNGSIKADIQIDGEKYDAQGNKTQVDLTTSTDSAGNVNLAFRLPKVIQQGQGTLSLNLQGADGQETWSHPLRIETGLVMIDAYPEGGDLIAGAPNTLYFQMRNQFGEAVDGEVELLDSKQKPMVTMSTFHDESEAKASRGMGSLSFTPQAHENYSLRLKKPAGTQDKTMLPAAKSSGVAMHIEPSVMPAGAPLQVELSNMGQARTLAVSVYCRGVLIALDRLNMEANITQRTIIDAIKPLGGVYRITVAEIVSQNNAWQVVPLAERLVYRQPNRQLQLGLKAEQVPGKQLQLQIDAKTEANQPSAAYITICGVNQSLLQLAEATTTRRLPAHFLLAGEVRQPEDLEFADFFLSGHRSAGQALDLLLGVQGWRRFKEVDSPAVLDQLKNREMQQTTTDSLPIRYYDNRDGMVEIVRRKVKEIVEKSPEQQKLIEAEKVVVELNAQVETRKNRQTGDTVKRRLELATAETQFKQSQELWRQFMTWFYLGTAAVLGVLSIAGIIALLARRATLPWHLAGTLGTFGVLGLIGTALLWHQQPESAQRIPSRIEQPAVTVAPNTDGKDPKPADTASGVAKSKAPAPPAARHGTAEPPGSIMKDTNSVKLTMDASGDKRNEDRKQASSDGIAKRKEPAIAAPPQVLGKINVPGNSDTQNGQRDRSSKSQTASGKQQTQLQNDQQRRNRLIPPTTSSQAYDAGKAGIKGLNQKEAGEEKKYLQPPSPTTGSIKSMGDAATRPGFAGGLGGGGLGGGGLEKSTSSASASDKTSKDSVKETFKKNDAEKFDEDARLQNSFHLREYSWKAEAKPVGITQATAVWSKTVYWHPLELVPGSGKLELPIDLPPNEGVYHFEVFGHDGEGRLGAASIDVPAPVQSVSLQTKLSKNKAKVGDVIQLECQVQNLSTRRQPQIIARVQLPEGTNLPPSLKQLRFAAKAAPSDDSAEPTRWSVQGRELTLIWAEMAAGQRAKLSIDLICNKPAETTTGMSKAFLENQESDAAVVPGLSLKISK